MENKFKIIETEEYTLAVSEKEIKHGEGLIPNEWYINSYRGYDKPFKNHNLDSNGYLKRVFAYQPKNNAPTLDLPLLPELVVEDDVELELKNFKSSNVLDILNMGNINYLSNGDIVYNPDLLFIKRDNRWFSKHKSATKIYSQKDMEKCFIAGGKSARNINNQGFDEFIKSLKQPKWFFAEKEYLSNTGEWKPVLLPSEWEIDTQVRLKTTTINSKTYLVGTYLYE